MPCTRALLEMTERGAPCRIVGKRYEEPRAAVAQHQEINLALYLVAHVAQLELPEPEVGPTLHRFQQVAGHECPPTGHGVCDTGPVPQKPLRFLAKRLGHAREPGADTKSVLQSHQQIQPT